MGWGYEPHEGYAARRRADRRVNEGLGLAGVLVILVALGSATEWVPKLARIAFYAGAAVVFGVVGLAVGHDRVGPALVVVVSALVAALAFGPTRERMRRRGNRWVVRRRWKRALRAVDAKAFQSVLPLVRSVTPVPSGDRLQVVMPRGTKVADLEAVAETLASSLCLRDVRVERDAAQAARAWVTLVRRDPLAGQEPLVWPHAGAGVLSLWDPIPVGIDEDGGVQWLSLPERNLLLGGEPGAGKSAALSLVVATAALDPTVKLWLFDGKLVELAGWAGCAEHSVGVDVAEAIEVLGQLRVEMEDRYRVLLSQGRRKVGPQDGCLHVVVVDELAHYLNASDRKQRAEVAELLRDLVSRGRAAGVIVIGATQKPSADVVPTALRDLFGFRWALRCSTPQASDTILGSGWASSGFSAAEVDASCRGVGLLLHEGGRPIRLRAFYLDDEDLATIAARAQALRSADDVPQLRVVEG